MSTATTQTIDDLVSPYSLVQALCDVFNLNPDNLPDNNMQALLDTFSDFEIGAALTYLGV